jgi:histone H3/H4
MGDGTTWRQCNICKTPIAYQGAYFICSVSTCNRKRTGMVFCSMPCFDAHLPMMRHRDAWAEPQTAPTREQALREQEAEAKSEADQAPARRLAATASVSATSGADADVLVVVSKLKKFIKATSGMSTSDSVVTVLSQHLRELAVAALRHAATDGRKTVLDRDFTAVLRSSKDV